MLRRLLPAVVVVLAVALGGAGCADDVSPAARIGDLTITDEDLLTEIDSWVSSPTLLREVQAVVSDVSEVQGPSRRSYDTQFVDFVLYNRIQFELHNAEFERLGLEVDDQLLAEVEQGFLGESSPVILDELGAYGDRLVRDIARQFTVQESLAEGYASWYAEAIRDPSIEVSPRYGTYDRATGNVVPPEGPRPAPSGDLFVEP